MNKKNIILRLSGLFVILTIVLVIVTYKISNKPVYIEYISTGNETETSTPMSIVSNKVTIEQEFSIPYDTFYGVALKIATYKRDNNTIYKVDVIDKTENKTIYSTKFNASNVLDNSFYQLLAESPIKVDKKHEFLLKITPITPIGDSNYISFYATDTPQIDIPLLKSNQALCMNIYGGSSNAFWPIITLLCGTFIIVLLEYIYYLYLTKQKILSNVYVKASILGIIIFLLLVPFATQIKFWDESDYIISGMMIAKGKILYIDYLTQHMPFLSYLTAIFSYIFKAGSLEQFRLIYYVFISIIYMGIYIRYRKYYGDTKMFILPIVQVLLGIFFTEEFSTRVLADNIQAICMIVLLLEFLQYLKDEKIDWKRSIIVSLCIFCSITSIFTSVYQIFVIFVGVVIKEILYWKKSKKITIKKFNDRYLKLLISCLIPFVILLSYLVATNSLIPFYEQSYVFNREVYSNYGVYFSFENYGKSAIQPFFTGIINFLEIFNDSIIGITKGANIWLSLVNIIAMFGFIYIILRYIMNKQYLKAITIFLFVCYGFTRTNISFHTISAWASIFTIFIIEFDRPILLKSRDLTLVSVIIGTVITSSIATIYMNHIFDNKVTINDTEQLVVSKTKKGEKIFLDLYSDPSVYLIYKDRIPVNRQVFILPWYMDWYETDTIKDIEDSAPNVLVYDEEIENEGVWKIKDYAESFQKFIKTYYEQDKHNSKVWTLKK